MWRSGRPYRFVGANFWYGLLLDAGRLERELDRLAALSVTNLRVLGAIEELPPPSAHAQPAVQPRPGEFDEALLAGLDRLLCGARDRGMTVVLVLNNMWQWSGGFASYVHWVSARLLPSSLPPLSTLLPPTPLLQRATPSSPQLSSLLLSCPHARTAAALYAPPPAHPRRHPPPPARPRRHPPPLRTGDRRGAASDEERRERRGVAGAPGIRDALLLDARRPRALLQVRPHARLAPQLVLRAAVRRRPDHPGVGARK